MLAVDEAVDAQVTPGNAELLAIDLVHFQDEGRIRKVLELLAVWIKFGDELPGVALHALLAEIELEVIAVGAHDRFGEVG